MKQYIGTKIIQAEPAYRVDGNVFVKEHLDIGSQALVFVGTRGRQVGWLASQSDMLADDWKIVE